MWPAKRLDFAPEDWMAALGACLAPGSSAQAAATLERFWAPAGDGIAGLSVRSLFDAYLAAQGWGSGDRIVFTAITVGDMPRIARDRGLEVASVDLHRATTEPDPAALAAALAPNARAFVFTHLYGARVDTTAARALCRARGVLFIEDCAEAYAGPAWRGHPESDVALFSFGPIKTATAFGGGMARVADRAVRARMRAVAAEWPEQPRGQYFTKVLKYGLLGLGGIPWVFGLAVRLADRFGPGHDALMQKLTRGFAGPDFFGQIRRRPCGPLLRVLERRLRQGDAPVRRRIAAGERLVGALQGEPVPAGSARPHAFWLVPVESDDPAGLVARLEGAGYNATRGRAFAVVENDPGVDVPAPSEARALHERVVFLPFSPEMEGDVLDELASLTRRRSSTREGSAPDSPAPSPRSDPRSS